MNRTVKRVAAMLPLAVVCGLLATPTAQAAGSLSVGASEDTYVTAANPSGNFATSTNARIAGDPEKIGFFKFDATALPGGSGQAAGVTKATLTLTGIANTQTPGAVSVYGSPHNWTETGLTYANKPGRNGLMETKTVSASTAVSFDVTTALQNDTDGINAFQVYSSLTTDNVVATRENATVAWRPTLVIDYGTTPVVKPNLRAGVPGVVGDSALANVKAGDAVKFDGDWYVDDAATNGPTHIDWYIDGVAATTGTVYGSGVAPGHYGPATSQGTWTATAGQHTLKMVMDVTKEVDESNEADNESAVRTFTVAAATNTPPAVNAGVDMTIKLPTDTVNLDATVTDPDSTPTTTWTKVSGPGTVTFGNAAAIDTTAKFSAAGSYVLRITANDGTNPAVSDDVAVTVQAADPPPPPPPSTLPYTASSFFKSTVTNAPVDAARTTAFQNFMNTNVDQAGIDYPKVNLNEGWSGHNWIGKSTDPIWKLTGTMNQDPAQVQILKSQGMHLADSVMQQVPTGTQDRLLVVRDGVFGYTAQFADVVPNFANRTFTASIAGIMWHDSNGLDSRATGGDSRNWVSRGRIPDAMQIPRSEIDAAVAANTGLGHVMQIFFVETNGQANPCFFAPMVGCEGKQSGWGEEGLRIRIKPSVDLQARGLTGALLVLAKTLQQNGGYLGDNSGSATQLKVGHPSDYVGTNLSTDGFQGKLHWSDFEVVQPGYGAP